MNIIINILTNPLIGGIIIFVAFYTIFTFKWNFKKASIIMVAMIFFIGIVGGFFGFIPWKSILDSIF